MALASGSQNDEILLNFVRWQADKSPFAADVQPAIGVHSVSHRFSKGRVFKAAMDGKYVRPGICLVNMCGWTLRPDVSVVTNVIQNAQPQRSPEEVKKHLCELQRAVLAECRRFDDQQQLPPAG